MSDAIAHPKSSYRTSRQFFRLIGGQQQEDFGAHERGLYYLGSSMFSYKCCWTTYYRVNSVRCMDLSERIKSLRTDAGLTQFALAEKAGVSQQLIAKIKRGAVSESRKLPKIARALGLTVDELMADIAPALSVRADSRIELSDDEQISINAYRAAPRVGRDAIMGAARGVSVTPRPSSERRTRPLIGKATAIGEKRTGDSSDEATVSFNWGDGLPRYR